MWGVDHSGPGCYSLIPALGWQREAMDVVVPSEGHGLHWGSGVCAALLETGLGPDLWLSVGSATGMEMTVTAEVAAIELGDRALQDPGPAAPGVSHGEGQGSQETTKRHNDIICSATGLSTCSMRQMEHLAPGAKGEPSRAALLEAIQGSRTVLEG
ncbi:hypothetical protein NDU88_001034 [Pleurodeles waltl]|uniref:Uncharacterized protein n=1 Tax=Pleurodeles waltl TaxID=8319 RepID=A0AAV7PA04_PLEWA|nr:hypothetical protein NDU88_001034 [Pleurodeles waltl]